MIEAAAVPETFFTVWANLFQIGGAKAPDRILIHGGTSGIGSLGIQIFAARGHKIFTTVGSDAKCEAALSFGAVRAINYAREDFVELIKAETDSKGVDVILDMVGADYIQRNIEAAAIWGRIVNIAYQKGSKAEVNFAPVLTKRLTLAATTLRGRTPEQKRAIRDALKAEVWPLVGNRIKPVIARIFPLAEAQQAHEFMAKTGHIGKILLRMG